MQIDQDNKEAQAAQEQLWKEDQDEEEKRTDMKARHLGVWQKQ